MLNKRLKSYFSNNNTFEIDNIVLLLSILYICLIEFRIFQVKSISLADPVFILLFSSILIKERANLLGLFKYNIKLVKIFFIFSIIWVASFIFPVLVHDDLRAFFDRNDLMIIGYKFHNKLIWRRSNEY